MKDPRVYLAHILECITKIQEYTREGEEVFLSEARTQDAVLRNFTVMGEATKRIPTEYREQHPGIPWRMMAAFRDVLMHDYEGVDLHRVWDVVEKELSPVKHAITAILPPLDQLEREVAGEDEEQSGATTG